MFYIILKYTLYYITNDKIFVLVFMNELTHVFSKSATFLLTTDFDFKNIISRYLIEKKDNLSVIHVFHWN